MDSAGEGKRRLLVVAMAGAGAGLGLGLGQSGRGCPKQIGLQKATVPNRQRDLLGLASYKYVGVLDGQ